MPTGKSGTNWRQKYCVSMGTRPQRDTWMSTIRNYPNTLTRAAVRKRAVIVRPSERLWQTLSRKFQQQNEETKSLRWIPTWPVRVDWVSSRSVFQSALFKGALWKGTTFL